MPYLGLVEG